MRITNNMLINNMVGYIGNNLSRMERYQNQLATGKKISVASDDPVVAARALKLRTDVSEIGQYQKNVKDAQSWMDITESAVSNVGDVLQRARELAVQAANGTNSTEDTQKIEEEVKQLRKQVIQLGNSSYAGRYIFSGYKTNTAFLDETTGRFTASVDMNEDIKYEIGIGDDINVNVPGGDLFNNGVNTAGDTAGTLAGNMAVTIPANITAANNTLNITVDGETQSITLTNGSYSSYDALAGEIQGKINAALVSSNDVDVRFTGGKLQITTGSKGAASGVNINAAGSTALTVLGATAPVAVQGTDGQVGNLIKAFDDFIVALDTGSQSGLSAAIGNIDDNMNNLLRVRADIGARVNRADLTSNRLDNDEISFTKLLSENEDVDEAETIINLQNEENVYKASLAGGARIIMPTLIDFIS